jgi:O-antigen/teichoic acid export membrane protein
VFPIIFGLVSIPLIIGNIGVDRFGIVTISWLIFGYFSIFDLGLSKAIINSLSNDLLHNDGKKQHPISRALIQALFLIGLICCTIIFQLADFLASDVFNIPEELLGETILSLKLVSIGVPITLVSSGFKGVLETYQRFDYTSISDFLNAVGVYVGLAAISYFTNNLVILIGFLLCVRLIVCLVLFIFSSKYVSKIFRIGKGSVQIFKDALQFGGWVAVSNFINPIMGQFDRYIIASLLTMAAVTYYTAPLDIIIKLNIIPFSIASVLFPAFSLSKIDAKSDSIFKGSVGLNLVITVPIVTAIILFSWEGLNLWLGENFANESSFILQLLAVGAFFTSAAQIPFTFIQANGQPKKTAVLQVIEAVFYIPTSFVLIKFFGIVGAAVGRVIRVSMDSIALMIISGKMSDFKKPFNDYILGVVTILVMLFLVNVVSSVLVKLGLFIIVNVMFLMATWMYTLDSQVKQKIKNELRLK